MAYSTGNIERIVIGAIRHDHWENNESTGESEYFIKPSHGLLALNVTFDDGGVYEAMVPINGMDFKHLAVEDINYNLKQITDDRIEDMRNSLWRFNDKDLEAFARSILSEDEFSAPF